MNISENKKNTDMSPINNGCKDCGDLTNIKVDVGVLKTQASILSQLCEKMDKVIEKLIENHDKDIGQIYQQLDKRRIETDDDIGELHERIDTVLTNMQTTERRLLDEMKNLKKEISESNQAEKEKLDKLIEWKWTIAGGIIVLSWLLSRLGADIIEKFLK